MQTHGESFSIRQIGEESVVMEDSGSLNLDGPLTTPVARLRARTINLGNFESARIEVGVVAFGEDHDALDSAALEAAKELLGREESNTTKRKRTESPLPSFEGAEKVILRLSFGLTINLGNYESARTDAGRAVTCAPGEVEEAWADMRAWVAQRIREDVRDIKSGGGF